MLLTRAGGRLAVAGYAAGVERWHAHALQVLELDGGLVVDIIAYLDPALVERAGLPLVPEVAADAV